MHRVRVRVLVKQEEARGDETPPFRRFEGEEGVVYGGAGRDDIWVGYRDLI